MTADTATRVILALIVGIAIFCALAVIGKALDRWDNYQWMKARRISNRALDHGGLNGQFWVARGQRDQK